jgi:hypothetical protein
MMRHDLRESLAKWGFDINSWKTEAPSHAQSSKVLSSLYEPDKHDDDYCEFIALSGEVGAFDIADDATAYLCGKTEGRDDELLFKTPDNHLVLAYIPVPGHKNFDGEQPPHRELTPAEASRWCRLNKRSLRWGLAPVPRGKVTPRGGLSRLDRDWRPELATAEPASVQCSSTEARPSTAPAFAAENESGTLTMADVRIERSKTGNMVFLRGKLLGVMSDQIAAFIAAIVKMGTDYVTFAQMKAKYPDLEGAHRTRLWELLPDEVKVLIEKSRGKGYRQRKTL